MSNTTDTTGCISHRQDVTFFVMFEDYRDVARKTSGKEHEHKLAAFWRVLETKVNDRKKYNEARKKDGLPEVDMWVEVSYSEFEERAQGVYKTSSFQVASAESERLGFSQSRVVKKHRDRYDMSSPMEDCKEYFFELEIMQRAIDTGEYPTPVEINSPLLKSIALRKEAKKKKRAIEINTTPVEINSPPIEINTTPVEINNNKYSINYDGNDNGSIEDTHTPTTEAPTIDASASHASVSSSQQNEEARTEEEQYERDVLSVMMGLPLEESVEPTTAEDVLALIDAPDNVALPADEDIRAVLSTLAGKQVTFVDATPDHVTGDGKMVTSAPKKPKPDLGPLIMPTEDTPWCAETLVTIHEARKGRRYPNNAKRKSDRQRDEALEYAAQIVSVMPDITRDLYINALDHLETRRNKWWLDNVGPATPKHMFEKDRVHEMLDDLKRQKPTPTNGKSHTSRNKAPEYNMDDYHVDESALDQMLESLGQPKGVTAHA